MRKIPRHRRKKIHPGPLTKAQKLRRKERRRRRRKKFTWEECEIQFPSALHTAKLQIAKAKRLKAIGGA